MSCWEILGLEPTATVSQVKEAYRRLAGSCHPDHGGDATEFHRLHLAYSQAKAEAEQPLVCKKCDGIGVIVCTVGWTSQRVQCPECNGQGSGQRT